MAEASSGCAAPALPHFLPNPQRILLGALDKWLQAKSGATAAEKTSVVHALQETLTEAACAEQPRLEAIPLLIQTEDPLAAKALSLVAVACDVDGSLSRY